MTGLEQFHGNSFLIQEEKSYRMIELSGETIDGSVDTEMIPYLKRFNAISWLCTTQSCCGHDGDYDRRAHIDFRVSISFEVFFRKIQPFLSKHPLVGFQVLGAEIGMPRFCFWLTRYDHWERQLEDLLDCLEFKETNP